MKCVLVGCPTTISWTRKYLVLVAQCPCIANGHDMRKNTIFIRFVQFVSQQLGSVSILFFFLLKSFCAETSQIILIE